MDFKQKLDLRNSFIKYYTFLEFIYIDNKLEQVGLQKNLTYTDLKNFKQTNLSKLEFLNLLDKFNNHLRFIELTLKEVKK